jgi:hypothetical protein
LQPAVVADNSMNPLRIVITLLCAFVAAGFAPVQCSISRTVALQMGFFDQLFGGGKKATASHILLKGPKAVQECEQLRDSIYRTAIGRGSPQQDGVQADKLMQAVSFTDADIVGVDSSCRNYDH